MRISHLANKVKSGRFLGLLLLIIMAMLIFDPLSSHAQSMEDLMNIKVNKLTDKQIEDLLIRGDDQGLSNQQILNMARKRGMPSDEVLKLRKRMEAVNEVRLKRRNEKVAATEQLRKALQYGGENLFESIKTRDSLGYELTILEKKIFGFAFFHNKALNFTPNFNMPTPKNYILGPGDQVIINIFGANNDNLVETITPDGKVSIRLVGLVHLSGLTIEMANSFLKEKLSDFYAGLKGSNPNTFISVTLGSVRTLKVNIVGEVKNPGTYSVPSMTRVFNALYAAGGPTANGTFRSIQVYRGGKLQSEVDIYQFLTKGQEDSNIGLEDNDVILVRPVTHRVEVEGEVRVPGLFEMKKGESLKDLLYYAGGFNELAFRESITVKRIGDNSKRIENVFADGFGSFRPIDGDVFIVAEMSDRYTNRVQIEGAVVRPGQYEVQDSLTIKGLIEKAGGLMGDAFLNRAVLYRTSKNFTLEVESIDLGKILDGTIDDVLLRNEDLLSVSSVFDLQEEFSLEISGEVNKPGIFPYAANMTVADLILRAGGLTEAAANSILEIARRVRNDREGKIATIITVPIDRDLSLSNEQQNTVLEPFDHVYVRKSPGYRVQRTVKVEGEVNYPGDYALESVTMRISDLLKRSGGLNQFAYAKGATLIRKTEYATANSDEETALTELSNLQSNSIRRDAENIEAEKQMLKRLNKKIQASREDFVAQELVSKKNEKLEEARIERLLRTGVISRADLREVELVGIDLEKIIEAPGSIHDLILEDGDIVTIPKELQTVRVRGEVLYPVTTRFVAGDGLRSYIGKAGGYSQEASRRRAYVLYANGDVDRTRGFLLIRSYPEIEPGAEIIVPELVRRRRINPSEFIGLATSFLTLYLLYERTF